jgi:hypothetical protein
MNSTTRTTRMLVVLDVAVMCFAFAVNMSAQVKTQTTTSSGQAVQQVTVERGEVVYVSGNDLMVKMEDGSIRDFNNVPESARATVGGRQLGIHDLKVGMKLERALIVTTTPQTVTTVQSVAGKVWHISPPNSVILTLEDGTNQEFKIPKGQKFMVDGQQTDAWGLKKGMRVSATKIVEEPVNVVEHRYQLTGSMPPPPPVPPANEPILIAAATPAPPPLSVPAASPDKLPATGSLLPLIGLLGTLCLLSALGLRVIRKG